MDYHKLPDRALKCCLPSALIAVMELTPSCPSAWSSFPHNSSSSICGSFTQPPTMSIRGKYVIIHFIAIDAAAADWPLPPGALGQYGCRPSRVGLPGARTGLGSPSPDPRLQRSWEVEPTVWDPSFRRRDCALALGGLVFIPVSSSNNSLCTLQ